MAQSDYFALFFVVSSGQNGSLLGCDEQEIIRICCSLVDARNPTNNEALKSWMVKPPLSQENENISSEDLSNQSSEENDEDLETVVGKMDQYLLDTVGCQKSFTLVTDGQLHLRQCFHPETCKKNIVLPEYFNKFYDLRKETNRIYQLNDAIESLDDIMEHLSIPASEESDFALKEVINMSRILRKILQDGHVLEDLQTVSVKFEPGICSKYEEVDNSCVVRARGLPWQSSDQDVAKFFRGLNIAKGGVALCLSLQGRRNGEALVRFVDQDHRDMALKRHKHHIGQRYIEVYRANGDDFVSIAGGNSNEAEAFLSRQGQVIVRMRGLPYECTAAQVVEFFKKGENSCSVVDGADGVLFVKRYDGRATGDAFVMFETEPEGAKALAKHREEIGYRYIELFRSTTAELQQVLNRAIDQRVAQPPPLIPQLPQVPLLPQQIITSGTRKDCIRLRGLPYEAQVEHILEFLGDHAKTIIYQGVHMVFNAQGQPSGEAFIQMDSEQSAFLAAQQRHHKYMTYGKKQRYIEVFQCSGEDMNVVLTGIPSSAQRTLLSPDSPVVVGRYGVSFFSQPQVSTATVNSLNAAAPYPFFYWSFLSLPVNSSSFCSSVTTMPSSSAVSCSQCNPAMEISRFCSLSFLESSHVGMESSQNLRIKESNHA